MFATSPETFDLVNFDQDDFLPIHSQDRPCAGLVLGLVPEPALHVMDQHYPLMNNVAERICEIGMDYQHQVLFNAVNSEYFADLQHAKLDTNIQNGQALEDTESNERIFMRYQDQHNQHQVFVNAVSTQYCAGPQDAKSDTHANNYQAPEDMGTSNQTFQKYRDQTKGDRSRMAVAMELMFWEDVEHIAASMAALCINALRESIE